MEFWDPLRIWRSVEARIFKFGMQIHPVSYYKEKIEKIGQRVREGVTSIYQEQLRLESAIRFVMLLRARYRSLVPPIYTSRASAEFSEVRL